MLCAIDRRYTTTHHLTVNSSVGGGLAVIHRDDNILHLQNTDLVSQWMSANLLSLNQSKTEFLLIGLIAQLKSLILLF